VKRWVSGITSEMTARQAADVALRERFRGLERLIRGVEQIRARRPDAVRRVRAGTRRTSAALDAWAPLIDATRSKKVRRVLKRLRRAAAETRAAEVAIDHFASLLAEAQSEERLAVAAVLGEAVHQERTSRDRFIDELTSFPLDKLARKKGKLLETLETQEGDAPDEPVVGFARRALDEATETVGEVQPQTVEELHEVRVRLKRVRYTLEIFRSLAPSQRFDPAYAGVRDWQARLGALNDLADHVRRVETLRAALEDNRSRLDAGGPELIAAFERLRASLVRERDHAAAELLEAWHDASVPRFVQSVARVFDDGPHDDPRHDGTHDGGTNGSVVVLRADRDTRGRTDAPGSVS